MHEGFRGTGAPGSRVDVKGDNFRVLSLILWWSVFVDHSLAEKFEAGTTKHLSFQHF
jgi:hypothetical protein